MARLLICAVLFILITTLSQGAVIVMNARKHGLSPIHILSGSLSARERLCLAVDYQLLSVPSKNPCQLICVPRMSAIYPVATRRYNVDDGAICGVNQICLEGSCVNDPKVIITETPLTNYLPVSAEAITLTRPTLTTITPTQVIISSAHSATEQPQLMTTPYSVYMDIPNVAPTTSKPVSSSLLENMEKQTSISYSTPYRRPILSSTTHLPSRKTTTASTNTTNRPGSTHVWPTFPQPTTSRPSSTSVRSTMPQPTTSKPMRPSSVPTRTTTPYTPSNRPSVTPSTTTRLPSSPPISSTINKRPSVSQYTTIKLPSSPPTSSTTSNRPSATPSSTTRLPSRPPVSSTTNYKPNVTQSTTIRLPNSPLTSSTTYSPTRFSTPSTAFTRITTTRTTTTPPPPTPSQSSTQQIQTITKPNPETKPPAIIMSDGTPDLPVTLDGIPTPNIDDLFFFK